MVRKIQPTIEPSEYNKWRNAVELTYDQKQLILGSVIGNMSIFRELFRSKHVEDVLARPPRLQVGHAAKNKDYVFWKYKHLKSIIKTYPHFDEPVYDARVGLAAGEGMYSFVSPTLPCLTQMFEICYSDNEKRKITKDWMHAIVDPIAVATWFMDSGIVVGAKTARPFLDITIRRTDAEGAAIVQKYLLLELGIESWHNDGTRYVEAKRNSIIQGPGRQSLQLQKRPDARKFIDLVAPFVEEVPSMMRKIEPFL